MEFSRKEYWNALSFLSAGYLPNPGIKARSPTLQADSLLSEPLGSPYCPIGSYNYLRFIVRITTSFLLEIRTY